ncbi:PucR family transcriptional regulator [Anaerobacillus sp. MEB173]|uniref:PucR family transcriptional regulator n=1 Tax=Anaerobacillus sp. MEB173 TaxID=3383345 RepID=UPI003F92C3CD
MLLTMKDIMGLDIMRSAIIKTPADFLKERSVEWVSITEAPVENFVRKNELVLTTGMGTGDDPKLFNEFVHDVIKSKASALAIATGRYIFDIYEDSIKLAVEHQFPIIEIPWEIRFADITQAVTQKINEIQQKELEDSQKAQQYLLNLILQGSDLNDVTKFLSQKLSNPVILITNRHGNIKGISRSTRKFLNEWKNLLDSNIVPKESEIIDASRDPFRTKVLRIATPDSSTLLQLPIIQTTNKITGYLYVLIEKTKSADDFLNHRNLMVLEHAVTASALWFLRESAVEETEIRLRDDFVWNLANGQMGSWHNILSRSKSLGYDVTLPYLCIVGVPENLETIYKKSGQSKESSYNNWLRSMIHYIEEEVYYVGESLHRKTMLTYQENKVVIFLEVPIEGSKESVNNFLNLIDRRLTSLLPDVIISWGIGGVHEGEERFHKSYEEAQMALEIGKKRKGIGQRVSFSETRMDRILLSLSKNEELRSITLSTITPLLQYDEQRNMDLIETFVAYHQNQSKVSQTARSLNLHRQSLLYRLRKIEALTGLSLADPDDMFLLDLSIKIWKIGIDPN